MLHETGVVALRRVKDFDDGPTSFQFQPSREQRESGQRGPGVEAEDLGTSLMTPPCCRLPRLGPPNLKYNGQGVGWPLAAVGLVVV